MLSQINSTALMGLEVYDINIEVDASAGLPSWDIVGLPDTAVKESKRIRCNGRCCCTGNLPKRRRILRNTGRCKRSSRTGR